MKKFAVVFGLILMCATLHNSCSVFKVKGGELKKVERQETKIDVAVNKNILDYKKIVEAGKSENTSKSYTEEITVKTPTVDQPIELTATFRIDTSSTLKADTALKLIDVNNKDVSVAIYQNRKTNELTAKITSKKGSRDIPFSELKIKRNYSESSSTIDTSKVTVDSNTVQIDSVNKSSNLTAKTIKGSATMWDYILGGVAFISLGIIAYIFIFKTKKQTK